MQTLVDYFLPRKYDFISQLRHSYAKDPLCMTRLIFTIVCICCKIITDGKSFIISKVLQFRCHNINVTLCTTPYPDFILILGVSSGGGVVEQQSVLVVGTELKRRLNCVGQNRGIVNQDVRIVARERNRNWSRHLQYKQQH